MSSQATCNFVKQQGFPETPPDLSGRLFRALSFQPRVVGALTAVAIIFQSAPSFLALSAALWWSALLPQLNPFDAVHNSMFRSSTRSERLLPAPPPRRFSMGMAASFMLGIGVSLIAGWTSAAVVLQVFVGMALVALNLGKLCLGSYIYLLLRGKVSLANSTLPWAKAGGK